MKGRQLGLQPGVEEQRSSELWTSLSAPGSSTPGVTSNQVREQPWGHHLQVLLSELHQRELRREPLQRGEYWEPP